MMEQIEELGQTFPLGQAIIGEQNQKDYIRLFGAILRLKNILTAFNNFPGNEILSNCDFQDYQSAYIDLIRQVEINIDYILMLVAKFHETNCEDKDFFIC